MDPMTTKGKDHLYLLTIGNSFSDDAMEYVWQIATSLGYTDVRLGNLYIGGCTLAMHTINARSNVGAYEYRTNFSGTWDTVPDHRMSDAICSQAWDYISLQQASGSSGMMDTYNSDLMELMEYVKQLSPSARLVWHMTWAYAGDCLHDEFYKYNNSQADMYQSIVHCVEKRILPQHSFVKVIPSGTAIQNARISDGKKCFTRDGYHLSIPLGRFIAGLTFVHTLTGIPLNELRYTPDDVSMVEKQQAVDAAQQAVRSPFQVWPEKEKQCES